MKRGIIYVFSPYILFVSYVRRNVTDAKLQLRFDLLAH